MLNRILIACILTLVGAHAEILEAEPTSTPKLLLHPAKILAHSQAGVEIAIDPPCGSQLYGIVATRSKSDSLQLAAAIMQGNVTCTGLSKPIKLHLPQLATAEFRKVEAYRINPMKMRLQIAPITSMQITPSNTLQASYEGRCGQFLGTLMRPSNTPSGTIGLAMVEIGPKPIEGECSIQQHKVKINLLTHSALQQAIALEDGLQPAARRLELHLAPISVIATSESQGKLASIQYRKRCNEAPVGVVMTRPTSAQPSRLGVLLARYPGLACESEASDLIPLTDLDLAKQLDVSLGWDGRSLLQPSAMNLKNLVLKAPMQTKNLAGRSGTAKIDFLDDCRAPAFASVYALDRRGHMSIGILTASRSEALPETLAIAHPSRCKKTASEVSWVLPYLSTQAAATDVFPMKLKGQSTH